MAGTSADRIGRSPVNVVQALTLVKRDLGAVSKERNMDQGPARYKYRAIEDVLNKLHGPLVEHGVVIVPAMQDVMNEARGTTKAGTPITYTRVSVKYLVHGPEGDAVTCLVAGEALDMSDKGLNKAMTGAYKVLLQQLFAIPFATDDPDDHYPEGGAAPERGKSPQRPVNRPVSASTPSPDGSPILEPPRPSRGDSGASVEHSPAPALPDWPAADSPMRRMVSVAMADLSADQRSAVLAKGDQERLQLPDEKGYGAKDANRWMVLISEARDQANDK